MKEFLEKYMASKKAFRDEEYEVEKKFGEFLEGVPGWRDILGSVIISNGYGVPKDLKDYAFLGDLLIPEVRDLDLTGGDRVNFKIRIPSDTWVSRWMEVGWFPLEWLTNLDTKPVDPQYIKQKLGRRMESLRRYKEEEEEIKNQIEDLEFEIKRIKSLLEEGK